jgi:hypothetical protein
LKLSYAGRIISTLILENWGFNAKEQPLKYMKNTKKIEQREQCIMLITYQFLMNQTLEIYPKIHALYGTFMEYPKTCRKQVLFQSYYYPIVLSMVAAARARASLRAAVTGRAQSRQGPTPRFQHPQAPGQQLPSRLNHVAELRLLSSRPERATAVPPWTAVEQALVLAQRQ